MASLSSTVNEDKNTNRSDPSQMYNINRKPISQLRPNKLDDASIQQQIQLIHEVCVDASLDEIAIVFDECNYNMQHTITRIQAGDLGDDGWRTARSNNKKKHNTNNTTDQTLNDVPQSDNQDFPLQHTSSTSLFRGNARRSGRQNFHHHHTTSNINPRRRGNNHNRTHFMSSNPYHSTRNFPTNTHNNKSFSKQQNSNETIVLTQKDELSSSDTKKIFPTDEYGFFLDETEILSFDNTMTKKLLPSSAKNLKPSSIPKEPVVMHPTIRSLTEPIDIQFGDIIWNDSVPTFAIPSDNSVLTKSFDDQVLSSSSSNINYDHQVDVEDDLSHYDKHSTTNEFNRESIENTNRLSSSSVSSSSLPVTDNTLITTLSRVSLEKTSHLSDQLTDALQQQASLRVISSSSSLADTTSLQSTPNAVQYISPTSLNTNPFVPNTFQASLTDTNIRSDGALSAFVPYNTPGNYPSIPRDYSQTTSTWSQQPSNYKSTPRSTMAQIGNYSQQASYHHPYPQSYYFGAFYSPPTVYPLLTSVDSMSTTGYETYAAYTPANYIPAYPHQPQYHHATNLQSNKYDRSSYDKEFFSNYGHTRSVNNDVFNTSQTPKDVPVSSKLSATAASFSQRIPLQTNNTGAMYLNSFYTNSNYPTTHAERTMTYPSTDNRDNRTGASYTGSNNRNHYYSQQRTHHNNSNWYAQQ